VSGLLEYLFNACGDGSCFDFNAKNVEAYYRQGSGKELTVDVSEILDLIQDPGIRWTQNPKDPSKFVLSTLGKDGLGANSRSRVLGDITVQRQKDGSFAILPDTYNFNWQENPTNNLRTNIRNIITENARIRVGHGVSFRITFTGTFRPLVPVERLAQ
jgi:hypothetical protein